jgi:photosystem II stability/assembly factor-like uncharacterized protein
MRLAILAIMCIGICTSMFVNSKVTEQAPKPGINHEKPVSFTGKIMRSTDAGRTWQNISNGLPAEIMIQGASADKDVVYLGHSKAHIYTFGKEPQQWQTENLKELFISSTSEYVNQVTGIFQGSTSIFGYVSQEGIFKKKNGTSHWVPLKTPETVLFVQDLVENTEGMIFISSLDGIHMSRNDGKTWERIYNQGWTGSMYLADNTLIASGQNGIVRTIDNGKTWQKVSISEGKPIFNFSEQTHYSFKLMTLGHQIGVLRNDNPQQYAGEGRVQVSDDQGATWKKHPADEYLRNLKYPTSLLMHKNKLYCSYEDGVIVSADNGKTWKTILTYQNSLENNQAITLLQSGDVLYCITTSVGC